MGLNLRETLLFTRTFFKHPRMISSVLPSSRHLIRRMLRTIDWGRARTVIEYGPGVGTVTAHILCHLRADARLIAIESSDEFVEYLRQSMRDPRLTVVHGSAAEVARILGELGAGEADYIVSCIPLTVMPPAVREQILRASCEVLKDDGAFVAYHYSPAVLPHVQQVFGFVRQDFEPLNVPPALIFYCGRLPR